MTMKWFRNQKSIVSLFFLQNTIAITQIFYFCENADVVEMIYLIKLIKLNYYNEQKHFVADHIHHKEILAFYSLVNWAQLSLHQLQTHSNGNTTTNT